MRLQSMMLLPVAFLTLVTATTLTSCTSCSSRGVGHYDTTLVDTMVAVNLDSTKGDNGSYVSAWVYLNDSSLATIQSAPNKKSQITSSNHMFIRVRKVGRLGLEACMILGDGEQFAGNSFAT